MAKKKINIQGVEIRVDSDDYICLTDIAKKVDDRSDIVLSNWLRNAGTLDFLAEWEQIYNEETFNPIKFDGIRKQAGKVGFVMTSKRWATHTNAIGIRSKAGRYGGTYAHKDIAFEFCSAVSPRFKLMLIQEFQRLKSDEAKQLDTSWTVRRELAKLNYHLHTDAVKNKLIPEQLKEHKENGIIYAKEADLLNRVVFGMSASEWKSENPKAKGNIRDNASTEDLLHISNAQALNYCLIKWDTSKEQRLELLQEFVSECRKIYSLSSVIGRLDK